MSFGLLVSDVNQPGDASLAGLLGFLVVNPAFVWPTSQTLIEFRYLEMIILRLC